MADWPESVPEPVALGVVLAAGSGRRMGQAKALLDWGGVPLVVWQARSLISGGCEKVLVVTGAEHAAVGAALEGLLGVAALYNPDHRSGRSTSVRACPVSW